MSIRAADWNGAMEMDAGTAWEVAATSWEGLLGLAGFEMARDILRQRSHLWTEFTVPKPDGTARGIQSPHPFLKLLQRGLLAWLEGNTTPEHGAHGFIKERSNLTAADVVAPPWGSPHKQRFSLVGTDISGAFPTVDEPRVRGALRRAGLNGWALHLATKVATERLHSSVGRLATGSPSSPAILNEVLRDFDREAVKRWGPGAYARYADDITVRVTGDVRRGRIALNWLRRRLRKHGFAPHDRKHFVVELGRTSPAAEVVGVSVRSGGFLRTPQRIRHKRRGIARAVAQRSASGSVRWCGCEQLPPHDEGTHRLDGLTAYQQAVSRRSARRVTGRTVPKPRRNLRKSP